MNRNDSCCLMKLPLIDWLPEKDVFVSADGLRLLLDCFLGLECPGQYGSVEDGYQKWLPVLVLLGLSGYQGFSLQ